MILMGHQAPINLFVASLQAVLETVIHIDKHRYYVQASISIALFRTKGHNMNTCSYPNK